MLKRIYQSLVSFAQQRRGQWWQPALLLVLGVASLGWPLLAGPAIALALSLLWPLTWHAGRNWRRALAQSRWGPALESLLAAFLFAVLTWAVLGFVITEHIPVDRGDHHIMIARADLLTRGLAEGRIEHWSHLFQGGDSLTDLYPVFLNWVTAAIHLLSPSGTAFVDSYSLLCVVAWGFRGFAAYTLARRFAGVVPSIIVALASLLDVGTEVFDGTWHGVFYWGMIHNNIALSLALLAVAFQIDVARRVSGAGLVRCAALTALAAVAHPLGMLFGVVSVAALGGATLFRAVRPRRSLWALAATCLGLVLAAIWVVPYVRALAAHGFNGSTPGWGYSDIGNGLFNGKAPESSFGAWFGFSAVALFCALASRKVPRLAVGLLALAFLLLALTPFMVQSHALEAFRSFLDAQQRRSITVLKAALVPSLALLFQFLWLGLTRRAPAVSPRALLGRTLVLGLIMLGPGRAAARGFDALVADLKQQLPKPGPSKYGKLENDTDDNHRGAFQWIKEQRAADRSPTPFRMTYWSRFDPKMHAHWTWVQGLETGVPLVDFGWVSANFLRYRPREMTPQGMKDWNIRYALGLTNKPDVPGFTLKHQVGTYRIFEFDEYDDRFVTAPEGVKISGLRVSDARIEFDVAGAAKGADVVVRSAWFPRWRASQNDGELAVRAVPPHPGALPGQEQIGLRVANGHVVLEPNRTMPGFWAGVVLSLLGLASVVTIAAARRRRFIEAQLRRRGRQALALARTRLQRVRPYWGRAAIALVVLGLLLPFVLPGRKLLIQPMIEGVGLEVRIEERKGEKTTCSPLPWYGRYSCGKKGSVEANLGITPTVDNSGEYGKFWPGIHLRTKLGGSTILRFSRADARSGLLVLRSTAGTPVDLVVRTSRGDTPALKLAGNQVQTIRLPAGLSRAETLELVLTSPGGQTDVILRGELQ